MRSLSYRGWVLLGLFIALCGFWAGVFLPLVMHHV